MNTATQNFKIQKNIAIVSVVLLFIKVTAWYITHSVAVLTDALESIVNVIASMVGLYSIYLSGKPKDSDHPYGHGKVEFISAAIEGVLIALAGFIIMYNSIINLPPFKSLFDIFMSVYNIDCLNIYFGLLSYS